MVYRRYPLSVPTLLVWSSITRQNQNTPSILSSFRDFFQVYLGLETETVMEEGLLAEGLLALMWSSRLPNPAEHPGLRQELRCKPGKKLRSRIVDTQKALTFCVSRSLRVSPSSRLAHPINRKSPIVFFAFSSFERSLVILRRAVDRILSTH